MLKCFISSIPLYLASVFLIALFVALPCMAEPTLERDTPIALACDTEYLELMKYLLGIVSGIVASLSAVGIVELRRRCRLWRDATPFVGLWEQWILNGRTPKNDDDDLGTQILRTHRKLSSKSGILFFSSSHKSNDPPGPRCYNGPIIINANVPQSATLPFRYVNELEFGVYQLLLRDNDEILVTPVFASDADYRKHILVRKGSERSREMAARCAEASP